MPQRAAQYVDALTRLRGVIDIVPTSNERSSKVVSYTINAVLTDELFSHHYDVTAGGPR